jgi:hypothetical protein
MVAPLCRLLPLLCTMLPAAAQRALVFEHADRWTGAIGAARMLAGAGFEVAPLPLDRPPPAADLILFGSFASEDERYRAYVRRHRDALLQFVAGGGVLLQWTQADQTEAEPPFLPDGLHARRTDADAPRAIAPGAHPLLRGIGSPLQWDPARTVWESFATHRGFQVLLAGDQRDAPAALLEAAHGDGRILLAALDGDKLARPDGTPVDDERRAAFARAFAANLAGYVRAVRAGEAPAPVVPPPPPEPEPYVAGSWTLAVLPDTQIYAMLFPGLFRLQTDWIVANAAALDIRYVLHLGDITNNNVPRQWQHARAALATLIGKLPLAIVGGNHDYGPNGNAATRDTLLNEYFPFAEQQRMPTFGGAFTEGRLDNTFHKFSAGGRDWIVLALEWAPRDEVVAWADGVMQRHPDATGILLTHAYLYHDGLRYDHSDQRRQDHAPHQYATPGSKNDGEQLWQKLVRRHDFRITLNGHVLGDGAGYLQSRNDRGNVVHQILANYQMRTLGGEAYLRLLEFRPDGRTVVVKTWSPLYESWLLEHDHQFTFTLER